MAVITTVYVPAVRNTWLTQSAFEVEPSPKFQLMDAIQLLALVVCERVPSKSSVSGAAPVPSEPSNTATATTSLLLPVVVPVVVEPVVVLLAVVPVVVVPLVLVLALAVVPVLVLESELDALVDVAVVPVTCTVSVAVPVWPMSFFAVIVTVYVPGFTNLWLTQSAFDVLPSPKSQWMDAIQ